MFMHAHTPVAGLTYILAIAGPAGFVLLVAIFCVCRSCCDCDDCDCDCDDCCAYLFCWPCLCCSSLCECDCNCGSCADCCDCDCESCADCCCKCSADDDVDAYVDTDIPHYDSTGTTTPVYHSSSGGNKKRPTQSKATNQRPATSYPSSSSHVCICIVLASWLQTPMFMFTAVAGCVEVHHGYRRGRLLHSEQRRHRSCMAEQTKTGE